MFALCSKARSAARRAQDEADALKAEAKELKQRADELLQNLRAAEDDVSKLICSLPFFTLGVVLTTHFGVTTCSAPQFTIVMAMCLPSGFCVLCSINA